MWGVLPIALKELLAGMDAMTIVWYRFLVAGLVLFIFLAYNRRFPDPRKVQVNVRWLLIIAAIGLGSNYFLFSFSLNYVNAETSEAVIQLTTLLLILGGVAFYNEPFLPIQRLGTLLIVVGMVLFFNDRFSTLMNTGSREFTGVSIVFVAALTWTVYALVQKHLLLHFSVAQLLLLIYMFLVFTLLPFITPQILFDLTTAQLLLLLFCCINTLIAYGCFAEAMNCWDASKVSAVLALAPLFTISVLKLIVRFYPDYAFSDRLNLISLLGALVLVLGSVFTALMPLFQQRRNRAGIG
jgi:drug/metabolite transporter (DMT)-like permease